MYSVVVAAVLSTGTPAPAFGGLFHRGESRNQGCAGCMGGCAGYSCMGNSCMGCNGCSGSGFLGIRSFFGNLFSFGGCQGCNGGCNGGCMGCMGCYGSSCMGCMGCMGGMPMSCMGCMGGCYGGTLVSSYDVNLSAMPGYGMGSPMMGSMPMVDGMAGQQYGMQPYATQPYGMQPFTPQPFGATPGTVSAPMPGTVPNQLPVGPPPTTSDAMTPPDQATVVVTLPADARMYVQNQFSALTGAVRVFRSPPLTGKKAQYKIRMEVERGGKVLEDVKDVELEPGKTARVHFAEPAGGGGTARIDVNVPSNSLLTVEGKTWPTGQRSIVTPDLKRGETYVYTLKLERDSNGRKETLTRDVSF
ncbi:MAG: TIGR03000 domain-containing protein, partial [Gemmataceae bacterium]|nr:TIGR03000 domain-containing protein [Gemmataceae bacterium]